MYRTLSNIISFHRQNKNKQKLDRLQNYTLNQKIYTKTKIIFLLLQSKENRKIISTIIDTCMLLYYLKSDIFGIGINMDISLIFLLQKINIFS